MRATTAVAVLALSLSAIASAPAQGITDNPDGVEAPLQREAAPLPLGEPEPESDFSFGGATQEFVVQAPSCQKRAATPNWIFGSFQFWGNDIAAASWVYCPVTLPMGARVTGIQCTVEDSSAAGDITIQLAESVYDAATSTPLASNTRASLATTGAAGYQVLTQTLTTPFTARRRSGNQRYLYYLFISFPADVVANASFRDCTFLWNRQVAPAPATATFSDVPSGHPQRQFVEALVAAGITGGCGGANYCPDSPLTRGQMAVFLSVALGLHFPN